MDLMDDLPRAVANAADERRWDAETIAMLMLEFVRRQGLEDALVEHMLIAADEEAEVLEQLRPKPPRTMHKANPA